MVVSLREITDDNRDAVLALSVAPEQERFVGNQTGGRVFLFLQTDDFWRDYRAMVDAGVRFVRSPAEQPYGTVAVFEDLYGNRWDLVQPVGAPGTPVVIPSEVEGSAPRSPDSSTRSARSE